MLKNIRQFISRRRNEYLQFQFEMDMDSDGQQIVTITKSKGDGFELVSDVRNLFNYGYHEISSDDKIIYTIADRDYQLLLALKSLNPDYGDNGVLTFRINVPVLRYIRNLGHITETSDSKRLQVEDKPIRQKARIEYDNEIGLTAKFGYAFEDSFIDTSEIENYRTDGHVRVGDRFFPIPKQDDTIAQLLDRGKKEVELDAIPDFYAHELPKIQEAFDTEFSPEAQEIQVIEDELKPTAVIDFDPDSGATLKVGFQLDDSEELIGYDELPTTANGNYIRRGKIFQRIKHSFGNSKAEELFKSGVVHIPLGEIPEFFARDLVMVMNEFNAVLTDLAKEIRIIDTEEHQPQVSINIDGKGWLEFDIAYQVDDYSIAFEILEKIGGKDAFRLDDVTWITADPIHTQDTSKKLEQIGAVRDENGHYRVPVSQYASLEEFIELIGGEAKLGEAYQDFILQIDALDLSDEFQLSEALENHLASETIVLRPYQRAGINWLVWMHKHHLHGILADDMGLGKTMQTICAMRLAYEATKTDNHTLVVAPKSVMTHWEREIKRCFPTIRVQRYHGSDRHKYHYQFRSNKQTVWVTTYGTMANDVDFLSRVPFYFLILDEATQIKNRDAKRTQAVKSLNAVHRFALSGTPVENRPTELWSIFDFLMRGHLGSFAKFERLFERSIIEGDYEQSSSSAQKLGKKIAPFVLRRTKSEVAHDLPDKIRMNEWCELTSEQAELYKATNEAIRMIREQLQQDETVNYTTHILPVITKLKQLCDHPAILKHDPEILDGRSEKFDWIINKVNEIQNEGEQVVVFSHFLGMLDLIGKALQRDGISHIRIDGSTNNRQQLIDTFNEGHATAAICSTLAAGYGINLIAANHVIHADLWWNPAVEDQATDRVHRIGQTKTVYVYRILTQNTLEDRIDRLLSRKRGIANSIMDSVKPDENGVRSWTRDELLEILRPLT